jgi:shikimate 5-dehydrogenase
VPEHADIVINATSIGLYPDIDGRLDIDVDSLTPSMVVADLIPNPPRTLFITNAEARGCPTLDGLGMLINQGVIAVKILDRGRRRCWRDARRDREGARPSRNPRNSLTPH